MVPWIAMTEIMLTSGEYGYRRWCIIRWADGYAMHELTRLPFVDRR